MSPRLSKCLQTGGVQEVPVNLGPRDQRNRLLYCTGEFDAWLWNLIANSHTTRGTLSIPEQLNSVFADFVSGRPLTSGITRCDPPKGEGIWRLKTPDLRLYGWADAPQCMVLAIGERKSVLKAPGFPRDKDLGKAVVAVRRKLGLSHVIGQQYEIFPAAR